jgi:small subunit ribosomal protein S5
MSTLIPYLDLTESADIQELTEVLVKINRSAAVVKGGRRFSFSALAVAGNRSGIVGHGYGKARQVPNAIEKANKDARKHLLRVTVNEHGSYGASMVKLVPAAEGTGIIAGAAVRAVCEMAGIRNILTKAYGSTNSMNLIKATFVALSNLRTHEEVAALRGVQL